MEKQMNDVLAAIVKKRLLTVVIFVPVLLVVGLTGCRTSDQSGNLKDSVSVSNAYETVNAVPQFSYDDNHFLMYWAVWRSLSVEERAILGPNKGAILSERNISWTVHDCSTGAQINKDGEDVWYLDQIDFADDGQVIPIKEATRPGFRYFTMLNLNSQHLRGVGAYVAPQKIPGEKTADWDVRRRMAFQDWLSRSRAKGTEGELVVIGEHRLYLEKDLEGADEWMHFADYPAIPQPMFDKIDKYAPRHWPIYYDERAHKPHTFSEPKSWRLNDKVVSRHKLRMRLRWDGCNESESVKVEIFMPKGELPPAGPNRPGRPDAGQNPIKVTEIDWPE